MNFFDTLGWWNLVWAVPLCVLFGVFLSAYWPFGKGPEGPPYYEGANGQIRPVTEKHKGPHSIGCYAYGGHEWRGDGCKGRPYVGFDPGKKVTGAKIYEPGDPPGSYGYRIGDAIHRQVEAYQAALLDEHSLFGYSNPHPGQHCSPECWRKPDGHRWAD